MGVTHIFYYQAFHNKKETPLQATGFQACIAAEQRGIDLRFAAAGTKRVPLAHSALTAVAKYPHKYGCLTRCPRK